jgi:hypothetical protein
VLAEDFDDAKAKPKALARFATHFFDQSFHMPKLAHIVYFTLNERTDASIEHLLSQCRHYLNSHDGLISFDVGTRVKDLDREVNGDFDVSLHLIFADRAAQDTYQVSDRHQAFIANNKPTWKNVVVYDSYLAE